MFELLEPRETAEPAALLDDELVAALAEQAKVRPPITAFQCAYHVVWCPKYRRRVIGGRIEQQLKQIIAEVVEEKGAWLVECETMPDDVHLLVEVDPQVGVHRLVKAVKGRASRVLQQEFGWLRSGLPSLWTNSYFVATVGGAPLSVIKRYVETQKDR